MTARTVLDFTPAPVDIVLERGDGDVAEFICEDEGGTAIDVSAYEWTAQFREKRGATDAVDFDIDTTDAADGIIRVHSTADITADILAIADKGVWDLQAKLTGSDPQTPIGGNLFVELDVTE